MHALERDRKTGNAYPAIDGTEKGRTTVRTSAARRPAFVLAALCFLLQIASHPAFGSKEVESQPNIHPAAALRQAPVAGDHAQSQSEPVAIAYTQAASGRYADMPVTLVGTLVSQLRDEASNTLILESDHRQVAGYLARPSPLPAYPRGSVIRLSGVCRMIPGTASQSNRFFLLELRSPDDIEIIAQPPWYTPRHLLFMLLALSLLGLFLTIRAAFFKWRRVNETAWIDRSIHVARERSRILEMIGSNRPLAEILQEICRTAESLLPGVACRSSLKSGAEGQSIPFHLLAGSAADAQLHEVVLTDDQGEIIGNLVLSAANSRSLAADREDIFRLLSELASLAIRQSILYRGLVYHSTHDSLTELPNRRLCESRLADAIVEAEQRGAQLAVIYIDINRFKYVNDRFGHKTGDLYLQQISQRLRSQLRSIDTLARIGGDEFVVIAPFPEAFDRAYALTTRLEKCFDEPFRLEEHVVEGSASFGFARYPEHGRTAEELTRHADHAMYIAKHEDRLSREAHALAIITPDELELALLRGRFRLAYQPQFSARGRLTGLEALLRLDDPVLGIVTPDAFISVAEKHPVILDIGAWALRTAIQDAMRWRLHCGEKITIAVNVSVRQLQEPGYANSVLECLSECGFPAERLELELIERSLMLSGDKVTHQLEMLREAGVRISLDDFGTEQSCLSVLHKLPIDTIKLDRSFIRAMDSEPTVLPIVQAIVSMAHSLGKRIVAEAIEHDGPVPKLLKMGKMDFQGFLLGKPVPADEVPAQLQKWRKGISMPEAFAPMAKAALKGSS